MNCEKCKNKKATVFYADNGGGQHALCAPCAEALGRITEFSVMDSTSASASTPFAPESSLFSLTLGQVTSFPLYSACRDSEPKCPFCSTSLTLARRSGAVGCPECYSVFGDMLFPDSLTVETAIGARMPRRRKSAIEHKRAVAALKQKLRLAVDAENYELAATLRDEIKKLEIHI